MSYGPKRRQIWTALNPEIFFTDVIYHAFKFHSHTLIMLLFDQFILILYLIGQLVSLLALLWLKYEKTTWSPGEGMKSSKPEIEKKPDYLQLVQGSGIIIDTMANVSIFSGIFFTLYKVKNRPFEILLTIHHQVFREKSGLVAMANTEIFPQKIVNHYLIYTKNTNGNCYIRHCINSVFSPAIILWNYPHMLNFGTTNSCK